MTDRLPPRPFPGLRPFERAEAVIFFGREKQVDELLRRLARSGFLAVGGSSGWGEASLVRAGLLPALEEGSSPAAAAGWTRRTVPSGSRPVLTLARARA